MLTRSDGEAIAVNLPDVNPVEQPEEILWVDATHPDGGLGAHSHSHSHSHDHGHD